MGKLFATPDLNTHRQYISGFLMNTNGPRETTPVGRVCFYWDGLDSERYDITL